MDAKLLNELEDLGNLMARGQLTQPRKVGARIVAIASKLKTPHSSKNADVTAPTAQADRPAETLKARMKGLEREVAISRKASNLSPPAHLEPQIKTSSPFASARLDMVDQALITAGWIEADGGWIPPDTYREALEVTHGRGSWHRHNAIMFMVRADEAMVRGEPARPDFEQEASDDLAAGGTATRP
jgi:hypothetical protein